MDKETREAIEQARIERKGIYDHRAAFELEVVQRLKAIETKLGFTGVWIHYLINIIAIGSTIYIAIKK